ncbi:hypothetical protein [Streptomyces sp. NPDC048248]|uniref:hypothetical protein n=1 Tax=Streptomyces sp. NPDC048248 TaxID=3365523 RepID=UPI00371A291C
MPANLTDPDGHTFRHLHNRWGTVMDASRAPAAARGALTQLAPSLASQPEARHRPECHKAFKEQISTRIKVRPG